MPRDTHRLLLPTDAQQPEQNLHTLSQSTNIAVLAGLLLPAICVFIIDLLDLYSNARPRNIMLVRAKIRMVISTYYGSCILAISLAFYAVAKQFLDIGCAAVGILISIYASQFSHSSSSRLYKIMRSPHLRRAPHEPHQATALRSYALRQLSRLAITSDLWCMLPFDQYLDLATFCVQLRDAPLLDMLVHMQPSYTTAEHLRQLQSSLPAFRALFCAGNLLAHEAFGALLWRALRAGYYAGAQSFPECVNTVIWCVQNGDRRLLRLFLSVTD